MRILSSAGFRAGVFAVVVAFPVQASAQSFLQNLFGLGQPVSRPYTPAQPSGVPAYSAGVRPDNNWNREIRRYSPVSAGEERGASVDEPTESGARGGKYRTLCVRTCDGYYFPIGNAVSRGRFMRDAAQCRASCGEEARLFYLPSGSENVATMLDLAGRSYLRMPTAFKYRKSLTDGCSCRPMPWSSAELQRHQRYAEEAARTAALSAKPAQTTPANTEVNAAPAPGPVQQPEMSESAENASVAEGDATVRVAHAAALAESAERKAADQSERNRQATLIRSGSTRGQGRPPHARRQQAVARASNQPSSGASWFAVSSSKYTWPGDQPRR